MADLPHSMSDTDAGGDEVIHDAPNFIRVYKSGRVERFLRVDFAPPGTDATTGVSSKDVTILPGAGGLSARIYLPAAPSGGHQGKCPVLVFFHGGGFCLGSSFDAAVHGHANALAARASAMVVSVEYRLAPEHPVPALYGDAWAALQWVAAYAAPAGQGPEPWLTAHADFGRVHVGGESAGANIAHHAAMRAGAEELGHGVKLSSLVLIHPYFLGGDGSESDEMGMALLRELLRLWPVVCPGTSGCDDQWINPMAEGAPSLAGLGCGRALVCVGGKDAMRGRGRLYVEKLMRSGWQGEVKVWEADGQGHGFHLFLPTCAQAEAQIRVIGEFLSRP